MIIWIYSDRRLLALHSASEKGCSLRNHNRGDEYPSSKGGRQDLRSICRDDPSELQSDQGDELGGGGRRQRVKPAWLLDLPERVLHAEVRPSRAVLENVEVLGDQFVPLKAERQISLYEPVIPDARALLGGRTRWATSELY
jgi:hypothetical protein